jgi:hypothetical protein
LPRRAFPGRPFGPIMVGRCTDRPERRLRRVVSKRSLKSGGGEPAPSRRHQWTDVSAAASPSGAWAK